MTSYLHYCNVTVSRGTYETTSGKTHLNTSVLEIDTTLYQSSVNDKTSVSVRFLF